MLLITLIKLILISLLLVAFYFIALRNTSSYKERRIYLCAIPVLSILFSTIRFEVKEHPIMQLPAPLLELAEQISSPEPSTTEADAPHSLVDYSLDLTTSAAEPHLFLLDVWNTTFRFYEEWVQESVLIRVYFIISFLYLLYLLAGFFKISTILRNGSREELCGYEICTSPYIETPFSFMRTIFLCEHINLEKKEMVVLHEIGHISNKHYLDVLFINLILLFLWFNPVVWWIRQELRDIDEFQADQYTLQSGIDLYTYQTSILEEVLNASPIVANGYNSSFIKKRFITMRQELDKPVGKVARVAIFSFIALLFCSFCFVSNDVKVLTSNPITPPAVYSTDSTFEALSRVLIQNSVKDTTDDFSETPNLAAPEILDQTKEEVAVAQQVVELRTSLSSSEEKSLSEDKTLFLRSTTEKTTRATLSNNSSLTTENVQVADSFVVVEEKAMTRAPSTVKMRDSEIDYYYLDDKYIEVLPQTTNRTVVYSIEKRKNETVVTLSTPIYYDWNWIHTSPMILVDNRTGDIYKLRSMGEGMPLDRSIVIRNKRGRNIAVRYHFPPLKKSVTSFDLIEIESAGVNKPPNGGDTWDFKSVKVSKYLLTDKNRPKIYE
ncbi:MAG: hypothetical protein ACRC3Z_07220 [Phocaeicola sp.]